MKIQKIFVIALAIVIIRGSLSLVHSYEFENHYLHNMACTYKWGNNMSSTSIIKTGWQDAISEWNDEGAYITYSVASQNKLQSFYDNDFDGWGVTFVTSYDSSYSAVHYFVAEMNTGVSGWNTKTAKSVGVHEFGHVIGLAHNSVKYSIMNEHRNRNSIYTVQTDDRNGVYAIYN